MKKTLALLIMLALFILPSQALAAPQVKMSTSEVNKIYFEEYNVRLKQVKSNISKIKAPGCQYVASLSSQYKQLTTNYNNLKKSKADKTTLSQAKTALDKSKKSLSEAKKACSTKTAVLKKAANKDLKEITQFKTTTVKELINEYNKGTITSNQFNERMLNLVKHVNDYFSSILEGLE
ncbi:hypothetical protein AMS62_24960 [Bacillus sp. FJAT-18019]|nr:hypothetical protein AMS62_24960 [Bacillus sp. FJAT-18019]